MNLEYKLTEYKLNDSKLNKCSSYLELSIQIENNVLNNLYFVILMQYDYFINFLMTILSDINQEYSIYDIQFPVFNRKTLMDPFHLKIYNKLISLTSPSQVYPSLTSLKVLSNSKHIQIYQLEGQMFFENSKINIINQFQSVFLLENKKSFYYLLKCLFDKLFLKLLSNKNENSYIIEKQYQPFFLILNEK